MQRLKCATTVGHANFDARAVIKYISVILVVDRSWQLIANLGQQISLVVCDVLVCEFDFISDVIVIAILAIDKYP